jgi:hypothetical protein
MRFGLQLLGQTVGPVLLSRAFLYLAGALLLADGFLIALHVLYSFLVSARFAAATASWFAPDSPFGDYAFSLTAEGGYPERFEYLKSALSIAALAGCFARTRQPAYLALTVVQLYILLDNALQLHEQVGMWLASVSPFFDRGVGDAAFFGFAGAVALPLVIAALLKSSREHAVFGIFATALVGMLAVFAVGADALHAALAAVKVFGLETAITALEDGGELMSLSIGCAFACALYIHLRDDTAEDSFRPARL